MASGAGSKLGIVLLLLAVLGAAGAYNYHRNYQIELQEQGARPLSGVDDAGLEALADAYRQEIAAYESRQAAVRRSQTAPAAQGQLIGEKVQAFERVQARSRQLRDLTTEIAQREARLREVEQEQSYRARDGMALHVSRLISI